MSTISIPLPDEDLDFLRAFTKQLGITPEGFLAQHARNLRLNLEAALHPDVVAASGVFRPSPEPLADFLDDMAEKHR